MARRYVRDNRGRFASVGATARGGRLRTASGNKRTTQTQQIKQGGPSGTISKPRDLKPGTIKAKSAKTSVEQAKSNYKAAFDKEQQARQAYFKTQFGTSEHAAARSKLDAATKKADALRDKWRDAKAGQSSSSTASKPPIGSQAATKIEQAKGRVKQFTQAKKSVDSQIRQVRQQIKDARSNAMTFGAVPGLKLKLLELQSKSKEYKATISKAKEAAK